MPLLPLTELEYAGHAAHTPASTAALAVPYVSAAHSVHACAPASGLKVPYGHAAQSPPSGPVYPASHSQSTTTVLPAGEFERAEHGAQVLSATAPSAPENLPAAQASHVLSAAAPAAVENVPAAHAWQVLSATAPSAVENLPAAQSVHASSPTAALCLPAAHSAHSPPSGPVKPATQWHAVRALLPAGATVFAGHASHVLAAPAPAAGEKVSTGHARHTEGAGAPTVVE